MIHLISHISPLSPTISFALVSAKKWSQKSRADLPTVKKSRQLLFLFSGYLPVKEWCLLAFLFKTMQFLPHIQLPTVTQVICYQTVFFGEGHLFLSNLSKCMRVWYTWPFSKCFQKAYLLQDLSGTETWSIAWLFPALSAKISTIRAFLILLGALIFHNFPQFWARCSCNTPQGASCPFVKVWND